MRVCALILALVAWPAVADTVFASRTIRPETVLGPADLILRRVSVAGAIEDPGDAIGMETRVALYAGRPIRIGDIGPPALIDRNQVVLLRYDSNGVVIATEGRALMRGGLGDRVKIMNLSSRATVWGEVQPDGTVLVRN